MTSAAQPPIGPALELGRPDHLLGLMGIDRAGTRDPALGQDLHRKQLGIALRFEGAGGANHAGRVFVRFVRTKSYIPNIALSHDPSTSIVEESFKSSGTGTTRTDCGSSCRSI